jgi:hypothetical protein
MMSLLLLPLVVSMVLVLPPLLPFVEVAWNRRGGGVTWRTERSLLTRNLREPNVQVTGEGSGEKWACVKALGVGKMRRGRVGMILRVRGRLQRERRLLLQRRQLKWMKFRSSLGLLPVLTKILSFLLLLVVALLLGRTIKRRWWRRRLGGWRRVGKLRPSPMC